MGRVSGRNTEALNGGPSVVSYEDESDDNINDGHDGEKQNAADW